MKWNLENKSVDEVDMDDPMDITTTPSYFAHYPGHDDSYRGIRRTCTAYGCGIYIYFCCETLSKHKEHQKWIKFRRSCDLFYYFSFCLLILLFTSMFDIRGIEDR